MREQEFDLIKKETNEIIVICIVGGFLSGLAVAGIIFYLVEVLL